MAEINLIKNVKALNSVRVPLETVPTNGKCKFNSKNNDLKNSFGKSSGNKNNNNEQKYNGNNDYNNGDKNIVITIIKSFLIIIVMIESYD